MKKKIPVSIFLILVLTPLWAQEKEAFLRQNQKRDSILIADQLSYGVHIEKVEEGTGLGLPQYEKGSMSEGIEIVGTWKVDTVKTRRNSNDLEASLTITSFDEGDYTLPDIRIALIRKDGSSDTLAFKGRRVAFTTIPVDSSSFTVHDIRGQIGYPLSFAEVLPYLLAALGLLLLAAIAFLAYRAVARRRIISMAPPEPAHIVALRKLDALRGSKFWAPDRQKAYYSGITDVLREYIAARYGFGAKEMTTAEIFKSVKGTDFQADYIEPLKDLFETSDYVKFAKMTVDDDYNAKALPLAVRFVTDTYRTDLDKESQADGDNPQDAGKNTKNK